MMQEELVKQVCLTCNSVFHNLIIHHIDGNRENNFKENLLCICQHCHSKIHQGLNRKDKNLSKELKNTLWNYRIIWLKSNKNLNQKMIDKQIFIEKFKSGIFSTRYNSKNRCYICLSKKNLKTIIPNYIEAISEILDIDKSIFGLPFCKRCIKEMKE